MYNTNIGRFCAGHPDWRTLLCEAPYCLKIKEDVGYIIFNYNQTDSILK